MTKAEKIKKSLLATKEKRKQQTCKVFELKLDYSKLSKQKLEYLKMLFIEAKWLYNHVIALNDIFKVQDKLTKVTVLNKDKKPEERDLKNLSSQMKQGIIDRTKQSVINLSKAKKSGLTIGKLKFKSEINSIPLKQFNNTYKLSKNNLRLQGFKKSFRILGLKQISETSEFANATLIKKPSGYYLKVTCFLPKEERKQTGKVIGLDFGIKDNITDSDGNKYNFCFKETKALKARSRKFNKALKGSKNRNKLKVSLGKAYERISNQKKDAKNKFVSKLVKENDIVAIQDENLIGWKNSGMKGWGRKFQYSIMGGIKSGLRNQSVTFMIPRNFPSTKLCPGCGCLNTTTLKDRTYICGCGYSLDRDVHSARNILKEAINQISMEHRNTMLEEKEATVDKQLLISYTSLSQEAQVLG